MSAVQLRGAAVAKQMNEQLAEEIADLVAHGVTPCLVSVQVGVDEASRIYRDQQEKKATALGITYRRVDLPESASEDEVGETLRTLNQDPHIHGIILQTPLPKGIDLDAMQGMIDPMKDVDGVTQANLGAVMTGRPGLYPSTALSAFELILASGIELKGKETVVIGRSAIVGKPVAMLLVNRRATVTMCHTGTQSAGLLEYHVRRAEILVVAVGQPNLIPGDWIRDGAVVIDVGINYVNNTITGDVDYTEAANHAAFITPVPGGVGPLTVTMLLRNTVQAAKMQTEIGRV
ncbi:MAG TPA: bifunctional 5,10-methylenetetrahydrofolate dehydrogenase/5,10-methenyltetrahydrofolate cyclohydrolase [Armatimonadota bacterium]|nr:bifunctional 5,10-methylenetetrahydrofolate dehydrogenase/5,10-methenyltetrahydrofolate cyclohydrolase [Armatimonadota bacterium]